MVDDDDDDDEDFSTNYIWIQQYVTTRDRISLPTASNLDQCRMAQIITQL